MSETGVKKQQKQPAYVYILAILFVIGISALLYIFRDSIKNLDKLGYFGIFLASFLINLTLVMPLPTGILTTTLGALYNPFFVGLAAGTGAALGELSGYIAGYSGREMINREGRNLKIENQLKKYGGVGIFFLALIPNPAFDVVGITAGALKYPFAQFLFWCWLGKVLKMLAFAYLGGLIKLPSNFSPF